MKKYNFEDITDNCLLLYRYIRGSHCHGTSTPDSDVDEGGVFMAPCEQLIGLGLDYQNEIKDEKNDKVWYELNKFMNLLVKSNPTILEALFVDKEFVLFEHPLMTMIKEHRDKFLTQKCFSSFFSYAKSQIHKARGLNKLINWDIPERKGVLDFVYTFHKQGSSKINNWLEYRGLKQEYCGLVNIPNMVTMLGCYYDWGNHFLHENVALNDLIDAYTDSSEYDTIAIVKAIKDGKKESVSELKKAQFKNMVRLIVDHYGLKAKTHNKTISNITDWYNSQKPIGYKGMVNEKQTSNELRLSSVEKGISPICHISYSKDAYSQHCRVWKEYQEWTEKRNPKRYESNLLKSYDSKNISECFRLVNCGIEVAKGMGFNVNRQGIDADFLLNIRAHKYEYDELMAMLEEKTKEMEEAMANSNLPLDIDVEFVNNLLITIRKEQFK